MGKLGKVKINKIRELMRRNARVTALQLGDKIGVPLKGINSIFH